jgi:hypothetical protein
VKDSILASVFLGQPRKSLYSTAGGKITAGRDGVCVFSPSKTQGWKTRSPGYYKTNPPVHPTPVQPCGGVKNPSCQVEGSLRHWDPEMPLSQTSGTYWWPLVVVRSRWRGQELILVGWMGDSVGTCSESPLGLLSNPFMVTWWHGYQASNLAWLYKFSAVPFPHN